MTQYTRRLQQCALALGLLGIASSAFAAATIEPQTELGEYTMQDGRVTAVLRIEETSASLTGILAEGDTENGYTLILGGNCHPLLPDFREIRHFTQGDTVEYACPQEPGDTPYYFIEFATAMLIDYDDTTINPEQ